MVGLIPLFAVATLEPRVAGAAAGFQRRWQWFLEHRPDLTDSVACMQTPGQGERRLLSVVTRDRLRRVLAYMLDEDEFLSPFGIRALSRYHESIPTCCPSTASSTASTTSRANRRTRLFGGNSNWRGPIWFPVNYLLIESLQKFHHYFGDELPRRVPDRVRQLMTLAEVAAEISRRLARHLPARRRRPAAGVRRRGRASSSDPHWRDTCRSTSTSTATPGAGRRESPDRMDGPGRQAAAAERRIAA